MRRLLSILLLTVLSLPLLTPILALGQGVDPGLPACCRREGKHHCMMTMAERNNAASHGPQLQAPVEGCPCCPASVASAHPDPLSKPETSQAIFAGIISHPTLATQTESKRRISRDRSRQKRGPPNFFLS